MMQQLLLGLGGSSGGGGGGGATDNTGSVYFDGNGDYLSLAASNDFDFGSGDFTIEGFFYKTTTTTLQTLLCSSRYYTSGNNGNWILRITDANNIAFASYNGQSDEEYTNFSASTSVNTWYHFALVRSGTGSNQTKFYLNGALAGSMTVSKSLSDAGNNGLRIGEESDNGPGNNFWNGYLSNIRIIKGTALYTSDFVVPASPLTNVTNTKLLCCQSTTSVTAAAVAPGSITAHGNVALATIYPSAVGSVQFDGNGDCLTVADNTDFEFGSGNFTLEAFIKYTGNPGTGSGTYVIASKWDNQTAPNDKGFILRISDDGNGDNLQWFYTTNGSTNQITTGSTVLSPDTWYHVAFVRNGTTGTFYIDGFADSTTVSFGSDSIRDNGVPFRIGANLESGSIGQEFNGLISNVRVIKGTALYTSNFTAPTSALTNVTNTKLLCCQTAGPVTSAVVSPGTITANGNVAGSSSTPFVTLPSSAVFYASGADFTDGGPNSYTITKVGNGLTAGNSTSKSGGGSYRFDGTDTEQYFYAGNNTFLDDSLSSWQFQCWARYDNTTGQAGNSSGDMGILVDQYPGSGSQGRLLFGFQDNELVMRVNGGTVELRADNNGSGLGNNIWYHVLLNWDGTTHRLFLNGVLDDSSTTVPAVYTGKRTEFGGGGDLSNYNLHGYMEHVLVEQGGTVKTSNFTPNNNGFVS